MAFKDQIIYFAGSAYDSKNRQSFSDISTESDFIFKNLQK